MCMKCLLRKTKIAAILLLSSFHLPGALPPCRKGVLGAHSHTVAHSQGAASFDVEKINRAYDHEGRHEPERGGGTGSQRKHGDIIGIPEDCGLGFWRSRDRRPGREECLFEAVNEVRGEIQVAANEARRTTSQVCMTAALRHGQLADVTAARMAEAGEKEPIDYAPPPQSPPPPPGCRSRDIAPPAPPHYSESGLRLISSIPVRTYALNTS